MTDVLHGDIETRSRADLKKEGMYRYVENPSTQILCFAFAFNHEQVCLWVPGNLGVQFEKPLLNQLTAKMQERFPGSTLYVGSVPGRVIKHIRERKRFKAHNAMFEFENLNRHAGFPQLEMSQMDCTQAKCAAYGLPQKLEKAAIRLGTHLKDTVGANDMRYLTRPNSKGEWREPIDHPGRFINMCLYCMDDVIAERGLDDAIPDLPPMEREFWLLDQRMNQRGWKFDREAVKDILAVVDQYKDELRERCVKMTGFKPSQTKKLTEWIRANGYPQLKNLQGDTVGAAVLDPECPPKVKDVLSLMNTYNLKAVTKLPAMLRSCCKDDRLRGMIQYHSAQCVPGDTEVLTPHGWQRLDQWEGGPIAQVHQDQRIEFLPATRFSGEARDEWLEVDSAYLNCRFTEGHTFPTLSLRRKYWTDFSAEHVSKMAQVNVPIAGYLKSSGALTPEQMRVLVMIQADGHFITDTSKGRCMRVWVKKERKKERARLILTAAGVAFDEQQFDSSPGYSRFTVRFRDYPAWLTPERKFFGAWLLDSSPEARAAFIDELQHWDGHVHFGNITYGSAVSENAEWVQTLAHLNGQGANICRHEDGRPGWSPMHTVVIRRRDFCQVEKKHWRKAAPQVPYCAQTQTGYWLARRAGKIFVTGNTGRKGARIVQLQNIFRPMIKNPEDALIAFRARDLQWIRDLYLDADPDKSRNPMVVAGSCVRSVLIADEGKILIFVDFSAIEARGGAWLTNERWKLDAFRAYDTIIPGEFDKKGKPLRAGPDLYRMTYARLFNIAVELIEDELRRQSGKVIDLSFLYAGGVGAQLKMVKNYKLDLRAMTRAIWDSIPQDVMYKAKDNWEEAVFRKDTHGLPMDIYIACDSAKQLWRAIHPGANAGWYELEEQAIAAVSQPGTVHEALGGKVAFKKEGRWLYMRLPSGRRIPYFEPEIRETKRKNRHGEVRYGQKLVYVDARYGRADMYGGSFFNHVNQGHCRDLLCAAERRLESKGYWPVGSVHDEPVTEVDIEFGSLEEACEIMAHVPGFAKGMPIAVEGYRSHRYGKH